VFLVAPGVPQADHLAVQHQELAVQFVGELLEVTGEAADLARVNNRLGHKALLLSSRLEPGRKASSRFLRDRIDSIYFNAESVWCK
jgi:hypothetical protein